MESGMSLATTSFKSVLLTSLWMMYHLLPDVLDLSTLGITGLLGRSVQLGGESNAEKSEHVSVSCLDVNISLDQGLPLLDHGPEFVGGQVHAMEAGETVLALDLLD